MTIKFRGSIIYALTFASTLISEEKMEKTGTETSSMKNSRKEDILYGGLKVFCEKGYDAATVDDIVKKAGCSHGLFYHYFKSKKEVFDEILLIKRDRDDSETDERLKAAKNCKEKLRIIINRMFNEMVNDENFAYYFYFFVSTSFNIKEKALPPPPPDGARKPRRPVFKVVEEIFAEGQKNGEFTKKYSAGEFASLLLSIVQGATLGYVIAPKEVQKNITLPDTEFIIDIFRKGDPNE